MRIPLRNRSLRLVFTVPLVTLTILSAGIVGGISYYGGHQAVDNVVNQLQAEVSARVRDQLGSFFAVPRQIVRVNAQAIARGLPAADDAGALERSFKEQVRIFESVTSIYFGNPSGGLVNSGREAVTGERYVIGTAGFARGLLEKYAIDEQGNRTALLARVQDFDARTRPWYARAVERGAAAWSPIYILATGQDITLARSHPVYDAGHTLLGVVSSDVFLSHIGEFLRSLGIGSEGQCFIFERSGLLIASSGDRRSFTEGTGPEPYRRIHAGESASPVVRSAVTALNGLFKDYHGIREVARIPFEMEGKHYSLQVSSLHDNDLDWLIGVVVSESDFMAPVHATVFKTLLFIAAALLFTTITGLYAAHRITRPIHRLHAFADALANGEWPPSADGDSSILEVDGLTRAFNRMAAQLRETLENLSREVTERTRAEAALQESEEHYRLLFDNITDAVFVHLLDDQGRPGRFIQVNDAACRRLGYTREELLRMTPLDISPPEAAERVSRIAEELPAHGAALFEMAHLAGDGRRFTVENNVHRLTIGGRSLVLSISRDITERKQVEMVLRESEENFRTFFEVIEDMILVATPDGRIIYFNPALRERLGYTPEELIGSHVLDLHPREKREEAGAIFAAMFRRDLDVCPLPLIAKNGLIIPVETRIWFGRWDGRECIFGTCRDLRNEQELLQIFDRLFRNNPVLMVLSSTSPDQKFIDINNAFLKVLGYSKEEVIGKSIAELGLFVNQEEQHLLADQLRRTGRITDAELQVRRKDGSILNGLFSGEVIESQGREWFLTVMVDITNLRHTQDALVESEKRWQFALEGTGEGVWDWNVQTGEVFFSRQWKAMLGFEEDEIGSTLAERDQRVHPDDHRGVKEELEDYFSGKSEAYVSEHRVRGKDGTYKWILDRGKVVQWTEDGRPLRMIGTHGDISDRKQAEEERLQVEQRLQQAQKTESLGRMAGGIAHHFNNMLGVVMGNLELALDEARQEPRLHAMLSNALTASQRTAGIGRSLLAYLGQTLSTKALIDLTDVAGEALLVVGASLPKNVHAGISLPSQAVKVLGDAVHLQQILTNLLLNAGEAIGEEEGFINVEIHTVAASSIHEAKISPPEWKPEATNYACVTVSDTGCGMDAETLDKIFDPFFSTKFPGRGLGLAVAIGLVRAHEGAVGLESREDWGSSFRLYLPIAEGEGPPSTEGEALISLEIEGQGLVLLAEDEPMVRDMAQVMLKRLGYEVITAGDGVETLEIFRERMGEIRLALLDLGMPRMGGWETLAALRTLRPDLPVILTSGYDEAQVMQGRHQELPQAFLHKPYRKDELKAALGAAFAAGKPVS